MIFVDGFGFIGLIFFIMAPCYFISTIILWISAWVTHERFSSERARLAFLCDHYDEFSPETICMQREKVRALIKKLDVKRIKLKKRGLRLKY